VRDVPDEEKVNKVVTPDLGKSQEFQSAKQIMNDSVSYASAKVKIKAQIQAKQSQQSDDASSK